MTLLRSVLLGFIAIFAAHPGTCLAQASCPWMNAATAGGFLGGEVQLAVSGANSDGDATCDFLSAANPDHASHLRIAVHTMADTVKEFPGYLALCHAGSIKLKGIGNEAIRCVPNSGVNAGEELIVGRVRERAFIITVKADWISQPPSPTKTRNPISDNSENLAEMVAGAIF
jgi:hypothetical protein